jgi:transcription-repair coupling factor (superfamily II helicase)
MTTYALPDLRTLVRELNGRAPGLAVGGVVPGARALALSALARDGWPRRSKGEKQRPVLVVVPHLAEAEDLAAGLQLLEPSLRVGVAPAELSGPYLGAEPPLAARLQAVRLLHEVAAGEIDVIVAPPRVLSSPVPHPQLIADQALHLKQGQRINTRELAEEFTSSGYRRVDLVEEAGEYALRGWVIDLHTGGESGIRLQLDDEDIEDIRAFDPTTQRSCGEPLEEFTALPVDIFPAVPERRLEVAALLEHRYPALAELMVEGAEKRLWWGALHLSGKSVTWLDLTDSVVACDRDEILGELARWWSVQEREWGALSQRSMELPPPDRLLVSPDDLRPAIEQPLLRLERLELVDGSTTWRRLATHPAESFVRRLPDLVPRLRSRRGQDMAQVLVVASKGEARRFTHLLREGDVEAVSDVPSPGQVAIIEGGPQHGFVWEGGLAVYGRRDLTVAPAPRRRRSGVGAFASDLRDLRQGDLVVHMDHGIGVFQGFRRVSVEGREIEMLALSYHGGDSLLVPVERADLIQKFASGDADVTPKLDRLGGGTWGRRKARVKKAVREMAAELLRLAAVRHSARGFPFSPDSPWQREFEDAFEFDLTPDQERAVGDIKLDMESTRPMDRLLCGDVGYGKTEVAIRAAFKAVLEGKQVAVLAPTTILVEQHLETFRRRFEAFPVETRMLSRFSSAAEARETVEGLRTGTVDVVVGTHRLLADTVQFRDLGLVILDEEQRFGVAQKERLKKLRTEVDVVAMSATPIPRTLNLSLSGLRDISIIETPPRDRQAVETSVLEFSEEIVREAVLYEMERGGQVYFVHNRVRSIGAFAEWLRRVVPEARVVVAHGQMAERHLERAMREFLDGEADVLLATAIIENGLDIPNANTLLVNRADRFGLAQLYQLRGRVGRSERLAFAYFLVPSGQSLTPPARARLAAIQEFCELGAGFRIAARDLEIRGAGNLLGAEQHGFLEAVGFETYCQLLEEAVAELEGRPAATQREVELRLGVDLQLPERYLPEASLRLSFYKRLAACDDEGELTALLEEMEDRYGPSPQQVDALARAQRVRMAARRAGVASVTRRGRRWRLQLDSAIAPSPRIAEVVTGWPGVQIRPSGEMTIPCQGNGGAIDDVLRFLEELGGEEMKNEE